MHGNDEVIETDVKKVIKELEKNLFSCCLFKSLMPLNDKNEVEVYGKIIPTRKEGTKQISIISRKMLEIDKRFTAKQEQLADGITIDDYHPYFCEFFIEKCTLPKDKYNSIVNQWLSIKIIFGEARKKCDIQGILLFSASPIQRIKCGIEFFDKKLEEDTSIESYVKTKIKKNQNDSLDDVFSQMEKVYNVRGNIYNVGQGNFVSLRINGCENLFFDIGESVKPNNDFWESDFIDQNMIEYLGLNPSYIILSHWDTDHILGVSHFWECNTEGNKGDYSIYRNSKWIAPNIKLIANKQGECTVNLSAQRLCVYLSEVGQLFLVNMPNSKVINNESFDLYQGSCTQTPGNKENNIGLILSIKIKLGKGTQRLLFTGDCSYLKMKKFLEKDLEGFDFIVSAHHGAASAVKSGKRILAPKAKKNAKAVISTGINGYKHPHVEHIAVLQNAGFKTIFTAGYKKIEFSYSEDGCEQVKSVGELFSVDWS